MARAGRRTLWRRGDSEEESTAGAIRLYKYSISYLTLLFAAIAVDALVMTALEPRLGRGTSTIARCAARSFCVNLGSPIAAVIAGPSLALTSEMARCAAFSLFASVVVRVSWGTVTLEGDCTIAS